LNEAAQRDRRLGLVTLILKRATASRPSGEWSEDDYDVLATGMVVGRIFKANRGARRKPVDVDAGLRPPRASKPDARLC
jgi:hypothetical protein